MERRAHPTDAAGAGRGLSGPRPQAASCDLRERACCAYGLRTRASDPRAALDHVGLAWGVLVVPPVRSGGAVDVVAVIEDQVRDAVRRLGVDPLREPDTVRTLVDQAISSYPAADMVQDLGGVDDVQAVAREVHDAVAGFGALQRFFDDPEVEEVWINEPGRVFVARRGRSELTTTVLSEAGGPRPGGADAAVVRPPPGPGQPVRRRGPAGRQPPARGDPGHHRAALGGQHPAVRAARLPCRGPGRARHAHPPGRPVPGRGRRQRPERGGGRWDPGRKDDTTDLHMCAQPSTPGSATPATTTQRG